MLQHGRAGVVLALHGGQARVENIAPVIVASAAIEPAQSTEAAVPRFVVGDLSHGGVGVPIAGAALDLCLTGAGLALRGGLGNNQTPETMGVFVQQPTRSLEAAIELTNRFCRAEGLGRVGVADNSQRGPWKPQLNSLIAFAALKALVA